jgi:hypothetical protein
MGADGHIMNVLAYASHRQEILFAACDKDNLSVAQDKNR